jgi:hypothetical protein
MNLETNIKNRNIRDVCRGINEFKKVISLELTGKELNGWTNHLSMIEWRLN